MKFSTVLSILALNVGLSLALPEHLDQRDVSINIHIKDEDQPDENSGCLRLCSKGEGMACPKNMEEKKVGDCYTCCLKTKKEPDHHDGDDKGSVSKNRGQDVLSELGDEIGITCIRRHQYCCTWSGCADCCRDTWSGGYAKCNTGWNPFSNEGECEMYA